MNELLKKMSEEEEQEMLEDDEDWEEYFRKEFEDDMKSKEEMPTKEGTPSYELIYASKLEEGEIPLGRVIGHENQKKELLVVLGAVMKTSNTQESVLTT